MQSLTSLAAPESLNQKNGDEGHLALMSRRVDVSGGEELKLMMTMLIHCRERFRSTLHLLLLTFSQCRRLPSPARNRKSNSQNLNEKCKKNRYVAEKNTLLEFQLVFAFLLSIQTYALPNTFGRGWHLPLQRELSQRATVRIQCILSID